MSKDASYASAAEIQAWHDSQPNGWESSVYLSSDESDEICVNPESEIRDKGTDPDPLTPAELEA
jgi:hypothetical protein